jgi:FlaA1/EpsC-like NDP-sugar epimerase
MQAALQGKGGEIYVLDMGEPVRIAYLAEQLIRLAGKEPGRDIQIVYTGLRPGEKLFEELFHELEPNEKTEHEKIFLAHSRGVDWNELREELRRVEAAVQRYDVGSLERSLNCLVPELRQSAKHSDHARVVPLHRANTES